MGEPFAHVGAHMVGAVGVVGLVGGGGQPVSASARSKSPAWAAAAARSASARAWRSGLVMARARASARAKSPAWTWRGGQACERFVLVAEIGDGVSERLGAVEVTGLGDTVASPASARAWR